MHASFAKAARNSVPLHAVTAGDPKRFISKRPAREAAYLKNSGFVARDGDLRLVPNASGGIACAVLGLGKGGDSLALATFSEQLPAGTYRFEDVPAAAGGANGALAWLLGTYQFTRYRKAKTPQPDWSCPRMSMPKKSCASPGRCFSAAT